MNNDFVNRKDRIIASAIEIISEAGLESLTTKNLAIKENMSESLLYRYFGGIDEVLLEVVQSFVKFDKGIILTLESKDIPHVDKVLELIETLATYYAGYSEIAAIALNYEGLMHNTYTRDIITESIYMRTSFIRKEIEAAIKNGEIIDNFTPEELTNLILGCANRDLLNRRIENDERSHLEVATTTIKNLMELLKIEK